MGIEPTKPLLAQSFIGFEDRGRHQSDARFHGLYHTGFLARQAALVRAVCASGVTFASGGPEHSAMHLLTRVELMWWLPTTGECVPARDLIGKEAELVTMYLAMRQPSIRGGLFIDVNDGPWSTGDNIDHLRFGVVWWRALTELLQGETLHNGYGPTYESGSKFERFDEDVVIEDVNMYGNQVMRVITVPLCELAEAVALEGPVFVALSRGIRSELEAERARTVKRKAEQVAKIDHLVACLLSEQHDIPTIEGLAAALRSA